MTSANRHWEYVEGRVVRSRFSWLWRGAVARIDKMVFRHWPHWYSRDFRYVAEYRFVTGTIDNNETYILAIEDTGEPKK